MKSLIFGLLFFALQASADVGAVVDVTLNPVGSFKAKTSDVKGQVTKQGDQFHAENIIVNLKDLSTGIGLRDEHMKNKYLEVEKFPEAILTIADGKDGKGTGKIKIRGIEKAISGTFELADKFLTAHFPIKISDFNMAQVNYKGVGAEDEVQVNITLPVVDSVPAKTKK